jgi:hypothetical protein
MPRIDRRRRNMTTSVPLPFRSARVLAPGGVEADAQLPFAGRYQLLLPVLAAIDDLRPAPGDALFAAFGFSNARCPEQHRIALAALL